MFGGLGGGLSILGLLLQIGLLFLLFKVVMGFVRVTGPASKGQGLQFWFGSRSRHGAGLVPPGFGGFGGGWSAVSRGTKLELSPADFSIFEQRLVVIQTAFGAEDFDRMREFLGTPEMASYFAEDLAANAKKGLINRVSNVTFLQGDLSEAWREPQAEYATVARRIPIFLDRHNGGPGLGQACLWRSGGAGAGDRGLDLRAACGRRSGRLEIIGDPASLIYTSVVMPGLFARASKHHGSPPTGTTHRYVWTIEALDRSGKTIARATAGGSFAAR